MPDFEKKIEKNMEKAEKIRSRIDELKRQLKHIESETADLMMASIRESTNMTVNDYEQIIRDLNMMQEMRNNGFTDEEILAMTIRKQAKKRRNRRTPMKHRIFSTAMAAMLLAVSSVGMSASAEEAPETTTAIEETTEQEETTTEPKTEEPTAAQPYSFSGDDFMAIMNALAGSEKGKMTFTPDESNLPDFYSDDYYDTDGNATLVKSEQIIYNSEEMQFIAVTTKDGHVFYVLINYSAENGEDNVYFLNKVDDFDLYALLYAGQDDDGNAKEFTAEEAEKAVLNAQAANGRVQNSDTPYQPVTTEEADAEEIEPVPVPMNMNSIILVGGVILLIAIGGVVFLLLRKKPNKPSDDYYEEESEDDIKFYDDNNEE